MLNIVHNNKEKTNYTISFKESKMILILLKVKQENVQYYFGLASTSFTVIYYSKVINVVDKFKKYITRFGNAIILKDFISKFGRDIMSYIVNILLK